MGLPLMLVTAGADCERAAPGSWLLQPVNAWSSLAFAAAGAWILMRAHRGEHGRTPELTVFGLAVAANALGSFVYHGIGTDVGHWAHDVGIYAVLAFVAVHDRGTVRSWPRSRIFAWYGGVLAGACVVRAFAPWSTDLLAGVLTLCAAIGEWGAFEAGLRPRPRDGLTLHLVAWILAIVAVVMGGASFVLGSSASPLCHPRSAFQWHAVWHVLQALAMAGYAYAAVELWSPADVPPETTARLHG
jgi:hypothetical protein